MVSDPITRPNMDEIKTISQNMYNQTGMWGAYLDFEYKDSSEPTLTNVCCSIVYPFLNAMGDIEYRIAEAWLLDRGDWNQYLSDIMWYVHSIGGVFVSYNAAAEGRAVQSMGIDPHSFHWVCLYSEWRQARNNNNNYQYGRYLKKGGFVGKSVPPHINPVLNKGKDNNEVGGGLADCIYRLFGDKVNTAHKDYMRDLIINPDKRAYTDEETQCIIAYCTSDVPYLPRIWQQLLTDFKRLMRVDAKTLHEWMLRRAEYVIDCAKMESLGIPLDKEKSLNLRANVADAKDTIITNLVREHYPFYQRERKLGVWHWIDKYDNFEKFVRDRGLWDVWPQGYNKQKRKDSWVIIKDENGKEIGKKKRLCRENDTLKKYDGIPELYAYRRARKNLRHLNWFNDNTEAKSKKDILESIGSDFHMRPFYGFYGTQTGRNAPPASSFIFAMSAWLRCLVRPPEGKVIIAIDYASQEFAIAAVLSGDKNMIEAYRSGDPYLYFAIKAGGVSKADGEWWKVNKHSKCDRAKKVAIQRKLFKATVLGLQYGMGAGKLAIKITTDTGIQTSQKEAKRLIDFHQKVFRKYWKWLDKSYDAYKRNKHLRLPCGWCVLGDNSNRLSVLNAPVQGTGSSIMREAVRLARKAGIAIICPLHDAIYALADVVNAQESADLLAQCMLQAVRNIIGDELEIRLDIDIHDHSHVWIEEKGEEDYNTLKQFLDPPETGGKIGKLMNTVYKEPVVA